MSSTPINGIIAITDYNNDRVFVDESQQMDIISECLEQGYNK